MSPKLTKMSSLSVKDLIKEVSGNESEKKIDFFGGMSQNWDSHRNIFGRMQYQGEEEMTRFPTQEFNNINVAMFHLEE